MAMLAILKYSFPGISQFPFSVSKEGDQYLRGLLTLISEITVGPKVLTPLVILEVPEYGIS